MSGPASVTIGAADLEYRWFGEEAWAGPALVLLHEGLGSAAMWKGFPDQLAASTRLRVLTYSREGYGASRPSVASREPDYMHREAELVLPDLLKALRVERPILFGHSDGASIALLFAAAHPEAVSALILEAPHVFVEPLTIDSITAVGAVFESDLRGKLARYHLDVDAVFFSWRRIWLDPRFRDWNIEADLNKITCPTLLIQGLNDQYGTLAQLHSCAARVQKPELFVLEDCGHSPHRDQCAKVIERSEEFINRVLGRGWPPPGRGPSSTSRIVGTNRT